MNQKAHTQAVRILVVDDEVLVNEFMYAQLTKLGYDIIGSAYNGPQAVRRTCELQPDIVMMDLRMPDPETQQEDHTAGLKAALQIQEQCPTPIILLTAYESPELTQQASAAGVGAYLVKPARDNEIDRAIAITLARANDLTEMRRLNTQLKAHNEELDAFAYTVAHDIKHQLAICTGYAELIEMDYKHIDSDILLKYIGEIVTSGHKLSCIVSELLLLAHVRKVEEIDIQIIDMKTLVQESLLRLHNLIEQHQVELEQPEVWPDVLGHAPWIEEVWVNYISNGIKYGGTPPHLTLGDGEHPNGQVKFWIRDNGKGLTDEQRQKIFVPFERLNQAHVEGQGLGLSIVHRIITKLNGNVGVDTEPGQGCTFYFTLPKAPSSKDLDLTA